MAPDNNNNNNNNNNNVNYGHDDIWFPKPKSLKITEYLGNGYLHLGHDTFKINFYLLKPYFGENISTHDILFDPRDITSHFRSAGSLTLISHSQLMTPFQCYFYCTSAFLWEAFLVLNTNVTLNIKLFHQLNIIILFKNVSHYSLFNQNQALHVCGTNESLWMVSPEQTQCWSACTVT